MLKKIKWLMLILVVSLWLGSPQVSRATERLVLMESGWTFKPLPIIPEQVTTVYLRLQNDGDQDVEGYVQLSDNGHGLGQERPFSSRAGGAAEEIWFRWKPTAGRHELVATAFNETHRPLGLVTVPHVVTVEIDTDRDGIPDEQDPDDDNDGMIDIYEITYGLNPLNFQDRDLDPDNDGLTNLREFFLGTDPHKKDTDGDGVNDAEDPAPRDPKIPEKPKPVVAAPIAVSGSGGGQKGGDGVVVESKVSKLSKANELSPSTGLIGSRNVDSIVPPSAELQNDEPNPQARGGDPPQVPSLARQVGGSRQGRDFSPNESWLSQYGLDILGIITGVGILFAAGFWIFKTARTQT